MSSVSWWRPSKRITIAVLLSLVVVACLQPPASPDSPTISGKTTAASSPLAQVGAGSTFGAQATAAQIPIDVHDAVWGSANAPCTIVTFQDLQCPFCGRSWQ